MPRNKQQEGAAGEAEAKGPRRISIELSEAVSERVAKLADVPGSPFSAEAIRSRLRARMADRVSELAQAELDKLEQAIA